MWLLTYLLLSSILPCGVCITAWKVSKYGVFSGSYFFSISVWIRENTDQKKLRLWTLFLQCIYEDVLKNYFFEDIPGFDVPNFPNFQILISKFSKIQMFNKIPRYWVMTISINARIFHSAKTEIKICFA